MTQPVVVITNDKWMRVPGGKLDRVDKELLKQAGKGAVVVNFELMIERMQKDSPEKYEEFKREVEKKAFKGEVLTRESLIKYGNMANEEKRRFDAAAYALSDAGAQGIRKLRVEQHMTWRRIARTVGGDPNQLFGMALCERSAVMCGEDYTKDPWN